MRGNERLSFMSANPFALLVARSEHAHEQQ